MKLSHLDKMIGGWFVGNFDPSVLKSSDFEVGIKFYKAGTLDLEHYHKIAIEITVIIDGKAEMGDKKYGIGDIVIVEPGDVIRFRAITDVTIVVVKSPSVPDDKFLT